MNLQDLIGQQYFALEEFKKDVSGAIATVLQNYGVGTHYEFRVGKSSVHGEKPIRYLKGQKLLWTVEEVAGYGETKKLPTTNTLDLIEQQDFELEDQLRKDVSEAIKTVLKEHRVEATYHFRVGRFPELGADPTEYLKGRKLQSPFWTLPGCC